jgi:hypothetical protein
VSDEIVGTGRTDRNSLSLAATIMDMVDTGSVSVGFMGEEDGTGNFTRDASGITSDGCVDLKETSDVSDLLKKNDWSNATDF